MIGQLQERRSASGRNDLMAFICQPKMNTETGEISHQTQAGKKLHAFYTFSEKAFAMAVKGNGLEPKFRQGDVIIIDPDAERKSGDICLVAFGLEATIRQVVENNKEFHILPFNNKHKTIVVRKNRRNEFNILGKVVMSWRKS